MWDNWTAFRGRETRTLGLTTGMIGNAVIFLLGVRFYSSHSRDELDY